MAFGYGEVKDLYDTLKDAGVVTTSLPDWATEMNRITNSDLYSAGLHDNLIKRTSHSLDRLLQSTGLVDVGREFGRSVGETVGAPETGAQIGASLPRTTVNFAPLLIPGVGVGATVARLGLTGLLSGAGTYTETGSPAAGLISGVTAAALPKVTDVAEQALLKRIGGRLVEGPLADTAGQQVDRVSRYFAETPVQKAASFLTGQAVAAGAMEAGTAGEQLVQGKTPENPLTVDTLLNLTLGQAPFAALHLLGPHGSPADRLQKAIDISKNAIELRQAKDALDNKTPIEKLPDVSPVEATPDVVKVLQETEQRLSQVRGEQVRINDDLTLDPEQKVEQLNKLVSEEAELTRTKAVATGESLLGDTIKPTDQREQILGRQVKSTDKWRAVFVDDVPDNPPDLRGKIVSYSTAYEPTPTKHESGATRYALPEPQWRTVKTVDEWTKRGRKIPDPNQPDLPTQPREPTREELFGHIQDLSDAETEIDAAQTPAQVQQALTKVNDVKAQVGLPPTNDATLKSKARMVEKSGLVPMEDVPKVAAKVEARDAQRRIRALTQEEAATASALMGQGGFSVIDESKLSHVKSDDIETKPVSDVVTDTAVAALASREGREAFAGWNGRDDTTLAKDAQDFVDLVERYGTLNKVPLEDAGKFLAERTGTVPWTPTEVQEFLGRPHVKVWNEKLQQGLANIVAKAPPSAVQRVDAGANFFFGIRPIETIKGLSKEGVMSVGRFKNSASDRGSMSGAEFELLKTLVPEAFKGENVEVRTLYRLLPERGPVVEVKKLGQGGTYSNQLNQARHELDTFGYVVKDTTDGMMELYPRQSEHPVEKEDVRPEVWAAFERFAEAQRSVDSGFHSGYGFVAPKLESEMPGYVEGLVRLPITNKQFKTDTDRMEIEGKPSQLYHGPHFGSEDTNVLAFYRGYEETLPDGSKAFHVIEVQSDWGQKVRNERELYKTAEVVKNTSGNGDPWLLRGPGVQRGFATEQEAYNFKQGLGSHFNVAPGHPLLRVYESLALKAAIQHAKEIGATKVILSDAETAMMTEGHDRSLHVNLHAKDVVDRLANHPDIETKLYIDDKGYEILQVAGEHGTTEQRTSPNGVVDLHTLVDSLGVNKTREIFPESRPSQERGMRLHYDQTLPSAMEKLTGERGEEVELGEHKAATLNERNQLDRTTPSEGSPVFRDASGNPKTQITGRAYDISHVPDKFTLTDPSRAPGGRGVPIDEQPFVPQTEEDQNMLDRMGVVNGGQGLLNYLKKSDLPLIRGLADDLAKYPEALARVTASVVKTDGVAYAKKNFNREVHIKLNHGLLDASDFARDVTIAHELVHGLTLAELDNPAKLKIVQGLEDLRQKVIDQLPKNIRKFYDQAVESDWHNRYLENTAHYEELGNDWDTREIVYGLLDRDEFVSQGLTNRPTQQLLKSLKAEPKQSWFHRFGNFVKELLGVGDRIAGTAFEEFLSRTDQLLQSGEYVAGFHNFAEGFYKNLGFSDVLAQGQTQRALGLVIDSPYGLTARSIFDSLNVPGVVRSREFIDANRAFQQMQTDRGDDFINHARVMDELGFGVTRNGMDELTNALLNGEVTQTDALDLLPKASTDYLFAKVKDYRDVLASVKAATADKNEGLVNLADVSQLKPAVTEAMSAINKILKVESEHQQAERTIQELQAVAPDGYFDAISGDVARAPVWMDDADRTKKGFGTWVKNFLQPIGQLARENPETAEVVAKGFQLPANQRKMVSEGLKPFGLDLDAFGKGEHELSHESVKRVEQALRNNKLSKAINDWIYLNQRKGKDSDGVTLLPESDPDVAKILQHLSAKERADVNEITTKHQISQQVMQSQTLEKMLQISATNGAVVAARSTGLKVSQNITLAESLLRALTTDRSDPTLAQQADAQVSLVQSKMTPEGFLDLLKYSQNQAETWKLWQQFFQKNPAWSSGQRYGKFLVEYQRGNRTFLAGVDSRKEAEQLAEGGRITKFERNQKAEEDQPPVLGPDSLGMITRLRELEQNQLDMLRSSLSPDELQQLRDTSLVEQFATEEAYRGGVPNLRPPPRGLTKGAEELPWLSNHFSWVNKTATYWSRQLLRAQARAHLLEPEIAQNPDLQKKLKTHFDNILQPDPEFAQRMNRLVTTWFMGYNPASAIINATQPFLTHVAELTSLTGKPLQSYRRTLDALAEVKDAVGNRGWKTPEHEWLMKHAAEDGERSFSMFDEQAAAQESIATNYKRALQGSRTQTLGQRLGTLSGAYTTAGMWMFKGVEKLNNEAALLSSFDYYREQGLSKEDARDKAYEFNHAVNFGGGRAQRPIGAFSGRGTFPRSAAMLATSMQSYVLGTTFQLTRYLQRGFFRPPGVTPHEVYAARKAATQMLATQLVAAGTLGLPFVSGAVSLLNAAFPDLELNRKLREVAAGLFSSDKENGSVLGDIAMTGVPSMFGWDLQSRLSMGNTVPGVSEVNGFQPELLLGAPANLISTFVKGGQQIAQGNPQGAESFVPSALKKITELVSSGGTVKDYRNRPLFQPTLGEGLGIALGFQPKRLSDFNAAQRIAKQTDDVNNRRLGQFHQAQAEEVLKGNFGNVRQSLLSRAQDDKTYNPIEGVRAVARAAEELTFPRDLRREGSQATSSARSQLLSAFRIDPQQPSEQDRLRFRTEIERRLGLPHGPSVGDQQIAFLMDQLRRQSPDATRVELRAAAEKLVRRQKFQTLTEPLE